MRSLLVSLFVLFGSVAQAESTIDKMYKLHFENVQELLAILNGVEGKKVLRETEFTSITLNGQVMKPAEFIVGIIYVNAAYLDKQTDPEKLARAFMELHDEGLCNFDDTNEKGVFKYDAECVSQALWREKQVST